MAATRRSFPNNFGLKSKRNKRLGRETYWPNAFGTFRHFGSVIRNRRTSRARHGRVRDEWRTRSAVGKILMVTRARLGCVYRATDDYVRLGVA